MWFLTGITNWLDSSSDYFHDAYLTVSSWLYPFSLLSTPLYYLYHAFRYLVYYFNHFGDWVGATTQKLSEILDWAAIRSYILSWLPSLETISNWFSIKWNWLQQEIVTWWLSVKPVIQSWIDIATQGLDALMAAWADFLATVWRQLEQAFYKLEANWDNFWTVAFPNLVNFQWLDIWWQGRLREIDSLIDSKLKEWLPFYSDLVEILGEIKQFLTSPVDWFGNKFMDWLEERW